MILISEYHDLEIIHEVQSCERDFMPFFVCKTNFTVSL